MSRNIIDKRTRNIMIYPVANENELALYAYIIPKHSPYPV